MVSPLGREAPHQGQCDVNPWEQHPEKDAFIPTAPSPQVWGEVSGVWVGWELGLGARPIVSSEPNPFHVPQELGIHLSTGGDVVEVEKLVDWPSEGEEV